MFVLKKEKEKPEGEGAPAPEKPSLSHSIMETLLNWVLLASFVMSSDSSGSVKPVCFNPGLLI